MRTAVCSNFGYTLRCIPSSLPAMPVYRFRYITTGRERTTAAAHFRLPRYTFPPSLQPCFLPHSPKPCRTSPYVNSNIGYPVIPFGSVPSSNSVLLLTELLQYRTKHAAIAFAHLFRKPYKHIHLFLCKITPVQPKIVHDVDPSAFPRDGIDRILP